MNIKSALHNKLSLKISARFEPDISGNDALKIRNFTECTLTLTLTINPYQFLMANILLAIKAKRLKIGDLTEFNEFFYF